MGSLGNIHHVAGVVGFGRYDDAFEFVAPVDLRRQIALASHEGVAKLSCAFKCDNHLCCHLQGTHK